MSPDPSADTPLEPQPEAKPDAAAEAPPALPTPPPPPPPPPPGPARLPPPAPMPPPPPAKGRGCLLWLLAGLVLLFFLTTVVLFIVLVIVAPTGGLEMRGGSTKVDHTFVEQTVEGEGSNKVLLVPIHGVIMEGGPTGLLGGGDEDIVTITREVLRAARYDDSIKAVLLSIDSPGGGITASDILHHEIVTFRQETNKPVVALMGDVAASGGYYVAAASQHIVAHPTTITGSIGVIMPLIGIEDLMGKLGIKSRPIKSGEFKDIGSFSRPMRPDEQELLQAIVMEYRNRFVTVVYDGMVARGVKISREKVDEYCDGRIFTGEQALKNRLVDELGYFSDAVNVTCKAAHIQRSDTRVISFHRKPGFLDILLSQQSVRRPQAITLKIDGLTPNASGRFMYLWSPGSTSSEKTGTE